MFYSCQKNKTEPAKPISGIDYFPLQDSLCFVYQVDSIVFNSFNQAQPSDTFQYLVKELITGSFQSDSTFINKTVERMILTDSAEGWRFDYNFRLARNNSYALRIVNNSPVVVLSFPLGDFKTWNGNLFNYNGEQEFYYQNLTAAYNSSFIKSDSAIVVLQNKIQNQITDIRETETFVRNAGMVARNIKRLNYKDLDRKEVDGLILNYTLIDLQY